MTKDCFKANNNLSYFENNLDPYWHICRKKIICKIPNGTINPQNTFCRKLQCLQNLIFKKKMTVIGTCLCVFYLLFVLKHILPILLKEENLFPLKLRCTSIRIFYIFIHAYTFSFPLALSDHERQLCVI